MGVTPAQAAVERSGRTWALRTRNMACLLQLAGDDVLLLPYWGARGGESLPRPAPPSGRGWFLDGQPLAYPVYGDPLFKEVCLVATRPDGGRDTRLRFVEDHRFETDGVPALDLVFQDELSGLRLTHHFQVFVEHDLVARSATIANAGSEPLVLERALSAALPLPPGDYDAWSLHGQWGREFQLQRRPLGPGTLVLESRRGLSSHQAHPWFAVRPSSERLEHAGPVWFAALAWSGSWRCSLEAEANAALHITLGIQPFDFAWRLGPAESFETPLLVCGYADDGLGGAARRLHTFEGASWLPTPQRQRPRPVLYNSWEATVFDVRAEHQIELARRAAELGIELFVVDDGWFGARDHDRAGLGDWTPNPRKFPHGLAELIDAVHALGMQFGIWVEPEMANPDSDLYRAHPDWAYHVPGRVPTLSRNQLVLNFARDDVREHIFQQLQRLLREHGRVDFLKWDHNRAWTEVGWPEQPERQREVWVRHVLGLYQLWRRLRAAFPELLVETCASGGGRADLGALRWTDQAWTSDVTDAADRLAIQFGYSHAHSPRTMVGWVTDVPNAQTGRSAPLQFRFHVAMQGVLGLGGSLGQWSAAELAEARQLIADYKAIRPLVQFGRQYWLEPPVPVGRCAVQYVAPDADQTAVFTYQVRGAVGAAPPPLRLQGLDPARRYQRQSDGLEATAPALMSAGVPPTPSPAPALDWRSTLELWHAI